MIRIYDPYETCSICGKRHYTHNAAGPADHVFRNDAVVKQFEKDGSIQTNRLRGDLRLLAGAIVRNPDKTDVLVNVFLEDGRELGVDLRSFLHELVAAAAGLKK